MELIAEQQCRFCSYSVFSSSLAKADPRMKKHLKKAHGWSPGRYGNWIDGMYWRFPPSSREELDAYIDQEECGA